LSWQELFFFNSLGKSYLSFNREDFLEINQSEKTNACEGHVTFHILIFSSETPQPNELTLGRKHL
jgi:hypothetical protein